MESPRLCELLAAEIVSRLYDTIIVKLRACVLEWRGIFTDIERQQYDFSDAFLLGYTPTIHEFEAFYERECEIVRRNRLERCYRIMREHQNLRYGLPPRSPYSALPPAARPLPG